MTETRLRGLGYLLFGGFVLTATATLRGQEIVVPPGARTEPTQMSGLPLQVDDLPPGTVAVRVVRRSFANNLIGQPVELLVRGVNRQPLQASTDADGRAMFTGLEVGDVVMARTSVDGEELRSQSFELPAEGGVRVALVAGIGAGAPTPPSRAPARAPVPRSAGAAGDSESRRWWIASAVSGALGVGLLIAGARQLRQKSRPRASASPAPAAALDRREALFQELIGLERAHEARRLEEGDYRARREALVEQLIAIDLGR